MAFGAAEVELVDDLERVAEGVAGAELVDDLGEDLADLVVEGVRVVGAISELLEVGEELAVDEVDQVVAGQRGVVVELAVLGLRRGPGLPAVGLGDDRRVVLPSSSASSRRSLLEIVEVLEEQQPRGLLGIVELGREPLIVPHDPVYVVESVLEHA